MVDGESVGEAGVVCKDQLELTLLLGQLQGIEDGRGVDASFDAFGPELVAKDSLPSDGPASILHANVVKIPEEDGIGTSIDILDVLADQNHVFDGRFYTSSRKHIVRIFEQHQGLSNCSQTILILIS